MSKAGHSVLVPGVVRLGTVEAENRNAALIMAEEMGLLDDKDAVEFTATAIVPPVQIDDRTVPE